MTDIIKAQALQLATEFAERLISSKKYSCKVSEEQNSYSVLIFSGNHKVKSAFFYGKNGVKNLLQGDKTTPLYNEISSLSGSLSPDTAPPADSPAVNEFKEPDSYIGTDESGKGDYFGPLIIAGVGVSGEELKTLREIGVRDSKTLSDTDIANIYPKIIEACKGKYNIITINPPKYNELYGKINNLNKLLAWGHAKAIENILTNHSYPEAISDKFGDESYIKNSLQKLGKQIVLHQETKAERYTAVAAASVLARHTFNLWFLNCKSKYGYELKKGASKDVEKLAGLIIKEKGVDYLNNIAKLHFKTTRSANNLFNQ